MRNKICVLLLVLLLPVNSAFAAMQFNVSFLDADTSVINISEGSVSWWMNQATAYNAGIERGFWGQNPATDGKPEITAQLFVDNNWYVGWNRDGVDNRVIVAASAANAPQNAWAHYVLTWTSGGLTIFYCNGVEVARNGGGTSTGGATGALRIGSRGPTVQSFLYGMIEDFRAYSRVLSVPEIESLGKSRSRLHITDGLILYWPLDDGVDGASVVGTGAALDRSGNGHNGTPVNTPTWSASSILNYP